VSDHKKPVAVQVTRVNKTFGSGPDAVHALKEASLTMHKGELMMIVGPSGCGKTTLLSVIAGTLDYDTGSVEVLGSKLEKMSARELSTFRSHTVGFIFQSFHLIPTLTVLENVAMPLLILNKPKSVAFALATEVLEKVGLGHKCNSKPKTISGGEQQRVAMARAIIHEAPLVICDEPTSSLDHATGIKVMELLKHIVQTKNRSVIVVTHDHRILQYADHIVEMDDGCIKNSCA
jgi:putative ABC transport system ATP-binding protein